MEVVYKTRALQRFCTDANKARKKYGADMARRINQRVRQLMSAKSVEELIRLRTGRCHALRGDRVGQYAMDLVHPYRLIFERIGEVIQIARIVEILDCVKWITTRDISDNLLKTQASKHTKMINALRTTMLDI